MQDDCAGVLKVFFREHVKKENLRETNIQRFIRKKPEGTLTRVTVQITTATSYSLGGSETICPLPMAVRLMADLRPSTDGSTVCTSLVAGKLQAASVPIA